MHAQHPRFVGQSVHQNNNNYAIQVAALAPLALLLLLKVRCDHLVMAHLN